MTSSGEYSKRVLLGLKNNIKVIFLQFLKIYTYAVYLKQKSVKISEIVEM